MKKIFHGQKGQALLLALVMLAVGSLIIGPLIGLVTTSLNVGRVTQLRAESYYAADAGVETAVKSLRSWYEVWFEANRDNPSAPVPDPSTAPTSVSPFNINGSTVNVAIGYDVGLQSFSINSTASGSGKTISIKAYVRMGALSLASIIKNVATTPGTIDANKNVIFDPTWNDPEGHGPVQHYNQVDWNAQVVGLKDYYKQCVFTVHTAINPFPNSTIYVEDYQPRNGTIGNVAGYSPGTTNIVVSGLGSGSIGVGAMITFGGSSATYQVAQDAVINSGSAAITINPGLIEPLAPNANVSIGGLGPIFRNGDLTIVNTGSTTNVLTLEGTIYVTGDTIVGSTSQSFKVDLNKNALFVESGSRKVINNNWALWIGGKSTVVGSGALIASGDIYLEPNSDTETGQYVLVMSTYGMTQVRPGITFTGTVAGDIEIDVQSGNAPTLRWINPFSIPGINIPGVITVVVSQIVSYQIQ